MLNFIASESKFGFFKYDRFLKDVKIGDVLKVRFEGGSKGERHQIYSAVKTDNEVFRNQFLKPVSGQIKVPEGKSFGFLDDIYIHPSIIKRLNLTDGMKLEGSAIKSFNSEKKTWSYKLI